MQKVILYFTGITGDVRLRELMEDPDTMIFQVGEPEDESGNGASKSTYNARLALIQTRYTLAAMIRYSHIIPFSWRASLFSCFYCRKTFSDFISLKEHTLFTHSDSEMNEAHLCLLMKSPRQQPIKLDVSRIDCKLCDVKIDDIDLLKNHLRNKHDLEIEHESKGYCTFKLDTDNFACHFCGETFETFFNLLKHVYTHFEKCVCEVCGKGFTNPNTLRMHRTIHKVGSHGCKACSKNFNSKLKLKNHFEIVHRNRKCSKCPHCGELFRDHDEKSKHMFDVHGVTRKKYTCQICQKVYLQNKSYIHHYKTVHTREFEAECEVCHKQFYDKRSRSEHMLVHKEKLEIFCRFCKKGFVTKKRLKQHIKIHNKPFLSKARAATKRSSLV